MTRGSVSSGREMLRSGELARLAGVSPDSLRHYERVGVLARPERTAGGYRVYRREGLDRARLVQRALACGFSLAELSRVLTVRDCGGVPCREAQALGRAKLAEVEQRLRELTALRARLQRMLREWDLRMSRTPRGQRAELLKALPETAIPAVKSPFSRKRGK
jgi:MerR family copper efflux transcriptional regulator